tara:strand:+ start:2894 stop:3154 length:261 start_codon:yes stop_codon:yes gene_type:complete
MNISITKKEKMLLEYILKDYIDRLNGTGSASRMRDIAFPLLPKVDQGIYKFGYEDWSKYYNVNKPKNIIQSDEEYEWSTDVWVALQ